MIGTKTGVLGGGGGGGGGVLGSTNTTRSSVCKWGQCEVSEDCRLCSAKLMAACSFKGAEIKSYSNHKLCGKLQRKWYLDVFGKKNTCRVCLIFFLEDKTRQCSLKNILSSPLKTRSNHNIKLLACLIEVKNYQNKTRS